MKHYGANKTLDIPAYADLSKVVQILDLYDRPVRKVVKQLISMQQRWIDNEYLQGIQRSKDLLFLWNKWCADGCQTVSIPPLHFKHSLMAKLSRAMRVVVRHEFDVGVINLISTALRIHQVYGVKDADIERMSASDISNIWTPRNDRHLIFGLYDKRHLVYGHGLKPENYDSYLAGRMIQSTLDCIFPTPYDMKFSWHMSSDLLHLRNIPIRLELEQYEDLTKAGPHTWKPKGCKDFIPLKSIVSEALDARALDSVPTAFTRHLEFKPDGGITLRPRVDANRTLHNIIDDFNEAILSSPYKGPSGMSYCSRQSIDKALPEYIHVAPGKIVFIKDKAGKIRTLAISSYTVNKTLAPLDRWVASLLERLPCDYTNQPPSLQRMVLATTSKEACGSKDLSGATEGFPVLVARRSLEHLLQYSAGYTAEQAHLLAGLWHEIMSSQQYELPNGELIRYAVGSGMGTKSSWRTHLALGNHTVVWTAKVQCMVDTYGPYNAWGERQLHELEKFMENGYMVCGDDVVIFDAQVAEKYHYLMTSLGVEINSQKSFFTPKDAPHSAAEFCKKLVVDGHLVSGQSPKVLLRGLGVDDDYKSQPTLFNQVFKTLKELKTGKTLSQRVLRVIANSYPRFLHHIPLEFGGLGFPKNGSSCCQCLAEDGFILYFYLVKAKSILDVPSLRDVVRDNPDEKDPPSTLQGQLQLLPKLASYSSYPENQFRKYDLDYRQLFAGEALLDKSIDGLTENRLRVDITALTDSVSSGILPDYIDFIDIVNDINNASHDLIQIRRLPSRIKDTSDDSISPSDLAIARTALKAHKMCKRKDNPFKYERINSDTSSADEVRSVLVDFAEYALSCCGQ